MPSRRVVVIVSALAALTSVASSAATQSRPPRTDAGVERSDPPRETLRDGSRVSDAGAVVIDRDGGAKSFRFTETDVEGRLRAPELVYFLRRVRAEFAAGDLGHRSFLRELSETRRDPHF